MPAIGITGGVATGKSTFCARLRELLPSATFFDADQAAHELVDLPEVKAELLREFGDSIFLPPSLEKPRPDLNRDALRAIILRDAAKKRALEQILHPRIRQQWIVLAETHRNSPECFFADIPLLYETGGETLCDRVVVVACSRAIQVARLMENKSMRQSEAEAMINMQMPMEEKIRQANHVVWNNGTRPVLVDQTEKLVGLWNQCK